MKKMKTNRRDNTRGILCSSRVRERHSTGEFVRSEQNKVIRGVKEAASRGKTGTLDNSPPAS